MNQVARESWEQVRAQGRSKFVLRQGVLRCGVPFALTMIAGSLVIRMALSSPLEPVWKQAIKFAFFALGFGLTMGATAWNRNEREYQKRPDGESGP